MNVQAICNAIKNTASTAIRAPFPALSAIVMLCSLAKRPGLSTIMSVINIVQSLQSKGIPTGPNPDGTVNLVVQMVYSIVDEVYRALREDANGQTATAPGAISIQATGGNAGGPIEVVGFNVGPFKSVTQIS